MANTVVVSVFVCFAIFFVPVAESACRTTANKTEDTIKPKLNGKRPTQAMRLPRSNLPPDFRDVLRKFKCNCYKSGTSNPFTVIRPRDTDVCPARTNYLTIRNYADGCWVERRFRHYSCPWTQCAPYGKCKLVRAPSGSTAYCVHSEWKQISIYLVCYNPHGNYFEYKRKDIFLPTCCSCKVYC